MKKIIAFVWLNVVLFALLFCLIYCCANTNSREEATRAALIVSGGAMGGVYFLIGAISMTFWSFRKVFPVVYVPGRA